MRGLLFLSLLLLVAACYEPAPQHKEQGAASFATPSDSLAFLREHHYTNNYNFIVAGDSLVLLVQQPEERASALPTDTFAVYRKGHIVVADIRILPTDTVDSVWVLVADEQVRFGWVHEEDLLRGTVPDDPISQFISTFAATHLLLFLLVIAAGAALFFVGRKHHTPFLHWRDIPSFYPTLLCLVVAAAALLYGTIQMVAPAVWQHFYYAPTLNPFSVPPLLSVFLVAVWAMVIIILAVVDEVFRLLTVGDAILYMCSVAAVGAANYLIFSITAQYFVGYVLFVAYLYGALYRYFRYAYAPYRCGKCGARLRRKGRCPSCGTHNA